MRKGSFTLMLTGLLAGAVLIWLLLIPRALTLFAMDTVQKNTGYELITDGPLELTFSLQPTVIARGLRLRAGGTATEDVLAADSLQIQVDLPALFANRLDVLDTRVTEGRLRLIVTEDGTSNLDGLLPLERSRPEGDAWRIRMRAFTLQDSHITASVGEIPTLEIDIPRLSWHTETDDYGVLSGHGEIGDYGWGVDGRVGPVSAIARPEAVHVDLDLTLDDTAINVDGSVNGFAEPSSLNLTYSVYGADVSAWGELLGVPEAFRGDAALTGRIRPDASGLAFQSEGHVADFDVQLEGSVSDATDFDARFALDGPDIGVIGLLLLVDGVPDGPFSLMGSVHARGAELDIRDLLLTTDFVTLSAAADLDDFPNLQKGTAAVRVTGQDSAIWRDLFDLPQLASQPFALEATLDQDSGEMRASLTWGANHLDAGGRLGPYPDFDHTQLALAARGDSLQDVLASFAVEAGINEPYDTKVDLSVSAEGLAFSNLETRLGPLSTHGGSAFVSYDGDRRLDLNTAFDLVSVKALRLAAGADLPDWSVRGTAHVGIVENAIVLDTIRAETDGLQLQAAGSLRGVSGSWNANVNATLSGHPRNLALPSWLEHGSDTFLATATVLARADHLVVEDLDYRSGDFDVRVSGSLPYDSLTGASLSLSADGPSLLDLYPDNGNYRPPVSPYTLSTTIHFPEPGVVRIDELHLESARFELLVDGQVHLDGREAQLSIGLKGPSLSEIGLVRDRPLPDLPFELTADLQGDTAGLSFTRLEASWGDSDITATGHLSLDEVPNLTLTAQSNRLDLVTLEEALQDVLHDVPDADDDPIVAEATVFSSEPLPLSAMGAFETHLDLTIHQFSARLLSFEEVSTSIALRDGALSINRFEFKDPVGRFSAEGGITPDGDSFRYELVVRGEDAKLGLFTSPDQPNDSLPRYTLDIQLASRGLSIADVASNLNGTVLAYSDGGMINNDLIDVLGGDFLGNILDTMFPPTQSSTYSELACLAFRGGIDHGVLKFRPGFAAQTPKVNAFVLGKIDLDNERLDLTFSTQARSGVGISASSILTPYFKVGGTLAQPELELDTASAAFDYWMAMATGGVSILFRGLFDRLAGEKDPCQRIVRPS